MRPTQLTGLGWLFIEAKRQLGTRSCGPKRGGFIVVHPGGLSNQTHGPAHGAWSLRRALLPAIPGSSAGKLSCTWQAFNEIRFPSLREEKSAQLTSFVQQYSFIPSTNICSCLLCQGPALGTPRQISPSGGPTEWKAQKGGPWSVYSQKGRFKKLRTLSFGSPLYYQPRKTPSIQ